MKRSSFLKTLLGIAIAPVSAIEAVESIKSKTSGKYYWECDFKSTGVLNRKFISAIDCLDFSEKMDHFNEEEFRKALNFPQ